MPHYRKPLAIAIALAVAAGAAGTAVAKPTGPEAAAKAASRAKLMAEHRGGTFIMLAKGAGGTLDPQINYTLQYWQLYQSHVGRAGRVQARRGDEGLHDRSRPRTSIPKPTDGGKTWKFTLRKGIKFSNGKVLDVKDLLYSYERLFKVHAPTAGGFYSVLVGGEACLKTPATCSLSKGVVVDTKAKR